MSRFQSKKISILYTLTVDNYVNNPEILLVSGSKMLTIVWISVDNCG